MAQNYTRQSSFNDGDTITASLFNDEYNQLVNAFTYSSTSESTTGHRHDGSANQGGNIFKIGDLDFLNKIEVDSTNNRWGFYVEVSSAAVEQIRIQDGSVVPVTTNDIDLGTASLQFKDLYIDGTANVDSLTLTSGSTVTTILDEDNMSSDSDTALVTQQSVKAYVDAQVTAQDLDFQADSGGALSIDLDSEALTLTGGTGIDTSGSGNEVTFAIDSTVATLTGTQTLTNKTLTSPDVNTPDIDGGTIDGTVIGGSTAAAGSFTTVSATGNITVDGTVDGRDVAADGTKLDGIEALADVTDTTNVTAAGALMDSELTDITAVKSLDQGVATTDTPSFTGLTTTADVSFGDNDKAIFGAGNDLQIFHDGSNSYITEFGIGDLNIRGQANINLESSNGSETYASFSLNGASTFYYDNSAKLATTSTGIDVTGNATFDDNGKAIFGAGSDLEIYHDGSNSRIREVGTGSLLVDAESVYLRNTTGDSYFQGLNGGAANIFYNGNVKLATTNTGIDVTGTLVSDGVTVDVSSSGATVTAASFKNNGSGANTKAGLDFFAASTRYAGIAGGYGATSPELSFDISGTDVLGITSTGVDVTGVVEATGYLSVEGTSGNTGAGTDRWIGGDGTAGTWFYNVPTGSNHYFGVNNSNVLAINSTGIDVTGSVTADQLNIGDGQTQTHLIQAYKQGTDPVSFGLGEQPNTARALRLEKVDEADADPYAANFYFSDSPAAAVGSLNFFANQQKNKIMRLLNNGDVSLYEDTGTTAKFYWDASAESLGIGTSSISTSKLHVQGTTGTASAVRVESTGADSDAYYIADNDASVWTWGIDGGNSDAWTLSNAFGLGTPKLTVKTGGNVGIGTDSPLVKTHIAYTTAATANRTYGLVINGDDTGTTGESSSIFLGGLNTTSRGASIAAEIQSASNDHDLIFSTSAASATPTECMRIDSNGNVGIGVSSITNSTGYVRVALGDVAGSILENQVNGTATSRILTTASQTSLETLTATPLVFETSGTERMRIDASGHLIVPEGITLGTAVGTYAAANTLDDYEEGDVATPISSGITLGDGAVLAKYTKVGSLVNVTYRITLGTTSSVTGSIILNLPFATQGSPSGIGTGYAVESGVGYTTLISRPGGSTAQVQASTASGTYVGLISTSSTVPFTWGSTDVIVMAFVYNTTS